LYRVKKKPSCGTEQVTYKYMEKGRLREGVPQQSTPKAA